MGSDRYLEGCFGDEAVTKKSSFVRKTELTLEKGINKIVIIPVLDKPYKSVKLRMRQEAQGNYRDETPAQQVEVILNEEDVNEFIKALKDSLKETA